MKFDIEKVQLFLLKLFVIMLPYHYMLICILAKDVPILKYWKETIIILMFFLDALKNISGRKKYKIKTIDIINSIFLLILMFYVIISDNKYSALYIARVYFLPMLLIPIVANMNLNKSNIKNLFNIIVINSIILSIWGIFQCIALGDKFLINIGYNHYFNSDLGYERLHPAFYISGIIKFQRLTSTFVAPNTCAMYFSIIFTLILFLHKKIEMNKKMFYFSIGIISIAILLTFSRSTWIAWGIAILIYVINNIKFTKGNLKNIIITFFIIIAIVLLIDTLLLNNTIMNIGTHLILNTINFKDSSMIGHIDSLKESLELFSKNVYGLGLGKNGPRMINLIGEANANLTESSYFLILYDVGIIGFFIYFLSYIKVILDNKYIRKKTGINDLRVVSVVTLMFLISYLFLPYVQEFELLVMLYIIVGIQYNNKILKMS
ncbi:MAG: hypothetical protein HFJ57_01025 [Clostridia bacterium]|nr:hypothetical protein [Clostridia bacterium]